MRAIVTAVLALALAVGCSVEPEPDYTSCEVPSDCVITWSTCCGGPAVAVRAESLAAQRAAACPDGPCPPTPGCLCFCGWPGQVAATCSAGRCEVVTPTRDELACLDDADCVEVSARCGACDDAVEYCVVPARLVIASAAVDTWEARVCGEQTLCDPAPEHAEPVFYSTAPRCVGGSCRPERVP